MVYSFWFIFKRTIDTGIKLHYLIEIILDKEMVDNFTSWISKIREKPSCDHWNQQEWWFYKGETERKVQKVERVWRRKTEKCEKANHLSPPQKIRYETRVSIEYWYNSCKYLESVSEGKWVDLTKLKEKRKLTLFVELFFHPSKNSYRVLWVKHPRFVTRSTS